MFLRHCGDAACGTGICRAQESWYYYAVYYVWEKGLMDSVDTHEFTAAVTATRAQTAAIFMRYLEAKSSINRHEKAGKP